MSIIGQGRSLTLVRGHSDFKVKCLTFGLHTQVSDSGPHGPLVIIFLHLFYLVKCGLSVHILKRKLQGYYSGSLCLKAKLNIQWTVLEKVTHFKTFVT